MEYIDIVRVKETDDETEVNSLLKKGWILLSSGFRKGEIPGFEGHTYSLGLTKDVAASLVEEENEYDNLSI